MIKADRKKSVSLGSSVTFVGYYLAGAHAWMIAIKKRKKGFATMKKGKRLISFVLCIMIVSALAITAYAAMDASYTPRTVTGNQVNFREGPSTTSTVLGTMNTGEIFNQVILRSEWSYGWPAPGTDIYDYYGGPVYGYVSVMYLS